MRYLITIIAIASFASSALAVNKVAISDWTSQVYDNTNNILYISTSTGVVERYNPATNTFLSPLNVGTDISSIDITPGGGYLLAADTATNNDMGTIERVNLSTNAITDLTYPIENLDSGADQIAALSDNQAIFSSNSSYTGNASNLRSINLTTWAIGDFTVGGQVQAVSPQDQLTRSYDYTTLFENDTETSAGGVGVFSATSDTNLIQTQFGTPLNGLRVAISPNDSVITLGGFNINLAARNASTLSVIQTLTDAGGGIAYDPTRPILYDGSLNSDEILEISTTNYSVVGSINPAGASLSPYDTPNNGMTVSGNGNYLFLYDYPGSDLYVYALPEPASLGLLGVGAVALTMRRRRRPSNII
jgi:hypothetical protein